MKKSIFGNTGVSVSALGFGCMRFPMITVDGKEIVDEEKAAELIYSAYKLGVNYFDSAYFYCNYLSEAALGKSVKAFRKDILISTKCPVYKVAKPGDYRRTLEEQLERLGMNYIDFYHFHGIGYDNFMETDRKADWLGDAIRAKEEGLIKHISFSFHDKPENMIKLIDIGIFESVLCQYNFLVRKNEISMEYANSKGLGVIVMGPVAGGALSGFNKDFAKKTGINIKSNAELAMRFVLSNPNINIALSGMESIPVIEENSAIASDDSKLSSEEIKSIERLVIENEKLAQLYCTGCNYCSVCPEEINISKIFEFMNTYRIYGAKEFARENYASIGVSQELKGKKADACTECGLCETRCPQKLEIRRQLKECHESLK